MHVATTTLPPTRRRRIRRAALTACLMVIAGYSFISLHGGLSRSVSLEHIDLDVYRLGARAILDRGNLYNALPAAAPGISLPFTYPPVAAILLAPLAVLPLALDGLLSVALTAALLGVVVRVTLRSAGMTGAALNWSMLVALPCALILDPVRVTLVDGQIDVVLMALVVWDVLGGGVRIGRRRIRGPLVGLAAAVKLTPAVFVLYFLARGRRRDAVAALVSFLLFTSLGFAIAPGDSTDYWHHDVLRTDRVGAAWYASNQSLRAVLTRSGLSGSALAAAWVLACSAVLALAWTAMRRNTSAPGALVTNAFAELLVSPISWTHHWVWIVPGLALLGTASRRTGVTSVRKLAVATFALFALGPEWLLPHGDNRELHWALWQQAIGGSYVWFALFALTAAAFVPRPATAVPPGQAPAPAAARRPSGVEPVHVRNAR